MYVLIAEWIPGVPMLGLGSVVEDKPDEHTVEVCVSESVDATNTERNTLKRRQKHQPRPREPTGHDQPIGMTK